MKGKIKDCTCVHEFQDQTYGKGRRYFNKGVNKYRCTVCSYTVNEITTTEKKK